MDGGMSLRWRSERDGGGGWVKGCLINLKQVQRSLQNANEAISLIGGVLEGRPVGASGSYAQTQRSQPASL